MFLIRIFVLVFSVCLTSKAGLPDAGALNPTPLVPITVPTPNSSAPTPPTTASHPVSSASQEPAPLLVSSEPEKSVVQIFNEFVEPNWQSPWQPSMVHSASGTGFLIEGHRIMTNAHVVAWASRLRIRKYHDPRNYIAHIEFVGHDVDLAVLKVDDESFYTDMQPLELGDLPKVRSTVVTYGFPAGGQQISYTRGVVSRIEVQKYVHIWNRAFLACQTDAAINPGNSGGPVIQDNKVAGVAFESVGGLENTSFFIPTTIVHHFLDDIKDGTYDGVPESGLRIAQLQNPSFRKMLKLPPESHRGVLVDSVLEIAGTKALIKPNDVILKIGDYPVDQDGTITYRDNTVGAGVAFDLAQNGQSIPLKIWRDGKELEIMLPMNVYHDDLTLGNQYDVQPPYFIFGGMVFTALSLDYIKTLGSSSLEGYGRNLIYELAYRHMEDPAHWRPQPVVLASILNHPANADIGVRGRALIDKINGIRIEKLEDVPRAFNAAKGPLSYLEFMPDDHLEVINTDDAIKANSEVLQTYNIPEDRHL